MVGALVDFGTVLLLQGPRKVAVGGARKSSGRPALGPRVFGNACRGLLLHVIIVIVLDWREIER